jgi:acyl transferase domain-containing protein
MEMVIDCLLRSGRTGINRYGTNNATEISKEAVWVPSLRRKNQDWHQLLAGLGALYSHGVSVDWKGFERDYITSRRRIPLPTYPFQRDSYWVKTAKAKAHVDQSLHPLLGVQLRSVAIQDIVFGSSECDGPALLDHHRIMVCILPAYRNGT